MCIVPKTNVNYLRNTFLDEEQKRGQQVRETRVNCVERRFTAVNLIYYNCTTKLTGGW